MNTNGAEPSENEGSDPRTPAESTPSKEEPRLDEEERQERGRAAMSRWSLHKAFMDDLEWELEAKKASDPRPPDPDPTGTPDPSVP